MVHNCYYLNSQTQYYNFVYVTGKRALKVNQLFKTSYMFSKVLFTDKSIMKSIHFELITCSIIFEVKWII